MKGLALIHSCSVPCGEAAMAWTRNIGSIHHIGRRSVQQDSFGFSDTDEVEKGLLAIVADGMGGLADGERMSQMVVVSMLQDFDHAPANVKMSTLLLKLLDRANKAVNVELGVERLGQCGSTVVAVAVRDDKLYYISVGDSRIYLYRDGMLLKMNQEHNYGAELDERVLRGEMDREEALNDPQRAALTSFIGMGDLALVDQNDDPFELESGDRILLMSDGVYGTVSDLEMSKMMDAPLEKSCYMLDQAIQNAQKENQDNYTCVILEYK